LSFDEFSSLKKGEKGVNDSIRPIRWGDAYQVSYKYARTNNSPAAATVMTTTMTKQKRQCDGQKLTFRKAENIQTTII